MSIESAATFLVCVILLGCGIIVLIGVILLVNNLLHRYWKNLHWNLPAAMRGQKYYHEQLDRSQDPPLYKK